MMKESPQWALGRAGEELVIRYLKAQGYFVTATSFIEHGGAPLLEAMRGGVPLPDTMVSREGSSKWVEVKTKSQPTRFVRTGRLEHGISLRLWRAYQQVVLDTGIPGALAILQGAGGLLGVGDFGSIAPSIRIYDGTKMGPDGMVFFDWLAFSWVELGSVALPLLEPIHARGRENRLQGQLL